MIIMRIWLKRDNFDTFDTIETGLVLQGLIFQQYTQCTTLPVDKTTIYDQLFALGSMT